MSKNLTNATVEHFAWHTGTRTRLKLWKLNYAVINIKFPYEKYPNLKFVKEGWAFFCTSCFFYDLLVSGFNRNLRNSSDGLTYMSF